MIGTHQWKMPLPSFCQALCPVSGITATWRCPTLIVETATGCLVRSRWGGIQVWWLLVGAIRYVVIVVAKKEVKDWGNLT